MTETSDWRTRWIAALKEQHDLLFDKKNKTLKPEFAEYIHCPVCNSDRSRLLFEKDSFYYWRCKKCSMVFMNPRMNVAATHAFYNSNVNKIYNETKFDETSPSTEMDDLINLENVEFLSRFTRNEKGKLLEIGSAKGFFLQKAKEAGFEVYGLELNQPNFEYSKKMLGENIQSIDLFDAKFPNGKFDVVYMRDVIEHIANPLEFLREINRITRPGGLIFLETHNIDSWINRSAGERHTVIFGFEHPNHWSPKTLSLALKMSGYIVEKVAYNSLDCTLSEMIRYMTTYGFTTIYPKPITKKQQLLAKILALPYRYPIWSKIDQKFLPKMANFFGKGSTMKIIARKQ